MLSFFNKESLIDQAIADTSTMLENVELMVRAATTSLRDREDTEMDIDVLAMDKAVNRYESEVRRKVFTHLAVVGTDNVYSALVLTSIIIDIERVGDYAKNIVGLAQDHPGRLHADLFEKKVKRIEKAVVDELLPKGRLAFLESDKSEAAQLIHDTRWVGKLTDRITDKMASGVCDSQLSAQDQVCLTLYLRYLKRISSHWNNMLTSVVNPFDRIGFKRDF